MQTGYLVDFEVQEDGKGFLPRMRSLRHYGFPWLFDRARLLLWHQWIAGFEKHLRDTETLEPFYFELLLSAAKRWDRQNPKRIAIEHYVALLRHEGRLYPLQTCYICEKPLQGKASLMTAFKPAHPECIYAPAYTLEKLRFLFDEGKSLLLEDDELTHLFETMRKGL